MPCPTPVRFSIRSPQRPGAKIGAVLAALNSAFTLEASISAGNVTFTCGNRGCEGSLEGSTPMLGGSVGLAIGEPSGVGVNVGLDRHTGFTFTSTSLGVNAGAALGGTPLSVSVDLPQEEAATSPPSMFAVKDATRVGLSVPDDIDENRMLFDGRPGN